MIILRENQKEILQYSGGKMGIAAVPGSGKTWTLSLLAVELLLKGLVSDDQEILIVTLVNSAVNNFYSRISQFIKDVHLVPHIGYRVRTLHGLAHDIVRSRPDLVGLTDDFTIIDERESARIIANIVSSWLQSHPNLVNELISDDLEGAKLYSIQHTQIPKMFASICANSIRYAKDHLLTPELMLEKLRGFPINLRFAEMIIDMYSEYQKMLNYLGGIDFDDLIRFALISLQSDEHYLQRLRDRWTYVLEDEAQDSSYLQEQILTLLTGESGNWVRVGDPNQAIYETFTTANPRYLLTFINRPEVVSRELLESGRSSVKIINLANKLVQWTNISHPIAAARDALSAKPLISPTKEGDTQPNPDSAQSQVFIADDYKFSPDEEIKRVVKSILNWIPNNREATVAVLVPRNERGNEVIDWLAKFDIPFYDGLLRSTESTRSIADLLGNLLDYLADAKSIRKMEILFISYCNHVLNSDLADNGDSYLEEIFSPRNKPEEIIFQSGLENFLIELPDRGVPDEIIAILERFFELLRQWLELAILPADQIIISASQDMFVDPADLALSYKLATLIRHYKNNNPILSLSECASELKIIAKNERRFLGFSDADHGFDPDTYKGKVVVTTIHKAKGLEWDRVYLMSINDYNFPSGSETDQYIFEQWFIKGRKNIQAETLSQIDALITGELTDNLLDGTPSSSARLDYIRERLRLLYVAITRARRDLIITWNIGKLGKSKPAVPLLELSNYLKAVEMREKIT